MVTSTLDPDIFSTATGNWEKDMAIAHWDLEIPPTAAAMYAIWQRSPTATRMAPANAPR